MAFYRKAETLSPLIVENGTITQRLIFATSTFSVHLLELEPGAKIKPHHHNAENELYYFLDTHEVQVFIIGQEHQLENTSNKFIQVLSVKFRSAI